LDLVFRDTPFPTTSAIRAVADNPVLTAIGQTTVVRVIALLSDSTQKEVTGRGFGSTYLTSNPNVATVDAQGVVTATGAGSVLITVNNEGATAVTRIAVSPAGLLTTVEGLVQYDDGSPAIGATLVIPGHGDTLITSSDGRFSITGVLSSLGPFRVRAYQIVNNQLRLGVTGRLRTITGGVTDAGIIVIKPTTNFVYWTTPVSGSWTDATKWSTGRVPSANDNVFIGVPGNITVTHSSPSATTIKSLVCDEDFILSGNNSFSSIADSSEIAGNLTLSAGTLTGSGALAIFNEFRWTGGRLEGNATIDIATSGTMFFSGGLNTVNQRTINNAGTILCNANIALDGGAIINNLTGAVFNVQTEALFFGNPIGFNNAGTFIKSAGLGTTSFRNVQLTNTGTINVNTGVLRLDVGGSSTGGAINVSSGATLDINAGSGPFIWSGTISAGAGTIRLIAGTLQIGAGGASFNFPNGGFLLSNGFITGLGTITNNGILNWTGGSITGSFNILNNGNINISGISFKQLGGGATLNNAGTVTFTTVANNMILNTGENVVFNNLANGVVNVGTNTTFIDNLGGNTARFINSGKIIKSDSAGTATLQVAINNLGGTIEVQSGTLTLGAGGTNTSGTYAIADGANLNLSGGTFNYSGGTLNVTGGVLNFSGGTHRFSGNYSVSGPGILQFSNGTLQIDPAVVATFNFPNGGFQWSGGTITGPGVLSNTGNFSITSLFGKNFRGGAILNNSGTVTWTSSSNIAGGEGSVFNNLASGLFDIQANNTFNGAILGGTRTVFNNAGTVTKSAGTGGTTLDVTFSNTNGTINAQTGTLTLSAGGTNTSGTYAIASTANLNLSAGTFNYTGGTLNVTSGVLNLSGGTHKFSGNSSGSGPGSLQLSNGTLQVDSAVVATFNFTGGGFQWTSGTIRGPGTLTNTGNFGITSIIGQNFRGRAIFNNSGAVTWTGTGTSTISSGEGSVFNNLASGTFDIQVASTFSGVALGGTRTIFNNAGTVIKSAGTGGTTLDVTFNNVNGNINVQTGGLTLSAGGNKTGGVFTVATGANLNFSGTPHVFSGSFTGAIDGIVDFATFQIDPAGATLNFPRSRLHLEQWNNFRLRNPDQRRQLKHYERPHQKLPRRSDSEQFRHSDLGGYGDYSRR